LAPSLSDEESLIVKRGEHAFVLLNLFPYNSGHLLVCPYRHVDTYDKATTVEVAEIAFLTQQAMTALQNSAGNQGFNIGMNQGEVAGAGIAAHLHQHIVPRWNNDANFFPIIAQTKALPKLLGDARSEIAAAWPLN
jgi:ATP adenylyltransferase